MWKSSPDVGELEAVNEMGVLVRATESGGSCESYGSTGKDGRSSSPRALSWLNATISPGLTTSHEY